jgi:hypothetical protein
VTVAAVAALFVAGCSGDGGGSSSGGSGAGNAGGGNAGGGNTGGQTPSCALVPASLVNASLGTSVGDPDETNNSPVILCNYSSPDFQTVLVRFQINNDAAGFARGKQGFADSGQPTVDIAGFQDEAYSSSMGTGPSAVNSLVARKGSVEVMVVSSASIDKEKDLIQKVFAALS